MERDTVAIKKDVASIKSVVLPSSLNASSTTCPPPPPPPSFKDQQPPKDYNNPPPSHIAPIVDSQVHDVIFPSHDTYVLDVSLKDIDTPTSFLSTNDVFSDDVEKWEHTNLNLQSVEECV